MGSNFSLSLQQDLHGPGQIFPAGREGLEGEDIGKVLMLLDVPENVHE
jgi:hypothetical protein